MDSVYVVDAVDAVEAVDAVDAVDAADAVDAVDAVEDVEAVDAVDAVDAGDAGDAVHALHVFAPHLTSSRLHVFARFAPKFTHRCGHQWKICGRLFLLPGPTWTPKVCKIMAFIAVTRGLGPLFYKLFGFR